MEEVLGIPSSGLSGSPITFGAYGAGNNPIIKGSNLITEWSLYSGNIYQKSGITTQPRMVWFDGAFGTEASSIGNLDRPNKWYWSSNVLYIYSTSDPDTAYANPGIEAQVRNSGVYTNNKHYITIDGITGMHCILPFNLYQGTGLMVQNCTATENGTAIATDTTPYVVINNNIITNNHYLADASDGGGIALSVGDSSNAVVSNNIISYCDAYGIGIVKDNTTGGNVYGNTIHHTGQNASALENYGIDCYGSNFNFYRNEIYSHGAKTGDWALYILGSGNKGYRNNVHDNYDAGIYVEGAHNTTLYYNLVYSNDGMGIIFQDYDTATVYNNVIYGNGKIRGAANFVDSGSSPLVFKNNIVAEFGQALEIIVTPSISYATIDYNLYYHSAGGNFMRWKGTNFNWSDWKSRCNCDQHSYNENPQFVSPGSNFHLLPTSPCIDHGIDIGLTQDFQANPIFCNPDIGAFEFTRKPAPPENLRVFQ